METIILNRRGEYVSTIPQKLLPGEFVIVTGGDPNSPTGKSVYIGLQSGEIGRLILSDELINYHIQASNAAEQARQIRAQVAEMSGQVNTKLVRVIELAQDVEDAKSDIDDTMATARNTIMAYANDGKAAIDDKMDEVAGDIDDYKAELFQAKTQAIQDMNANYNTKNGQLDDKMDEVDRNIGILARDVGVYKNQIDAKVAEGQQEITDTYQARKAEIDAKIDDIVALKSSAEQIATQALNKTNDLENELSEVSSKADRNTSNVNNLQFDVDSMIHGWYVDVQKRLIFTDVDGNPIGEPIEGIGGSGGGGGGQSVTTADMTANNTTGWINKSFNKDDTVNVKILWTSIENDMPTGNGSVTIRVNGLIKASYEVPQGEITVDLTSYLGTGTNNVKITVSDMYDQARTLGFNISILDLRITSSFNTAQPFEGTIPVSYTPYGEFEKTVSIEVDNQVIHTQSTSVSGRQLTYVIPAQSHGAHKLRIYYDTVINNQSVRSNILYFEFTSIEDLNNTPIITSSFNETSVNQYSTVGIPYRVYVPNSATANVELYVNNTLISTQEVDRTEQYYSFRANTAGATVFEIRVGNQTKQIEFTVIESDVTIEAETEDLALYLSSQGRSNNEETRNVWTYNNIQAQFSNFTWRRDGWQQDKDGITVLRLNDKARLTIPYKIFETDFKNTGKTIEIEFATRDVVDYSAVILSCLADNIGLQITPQSVTFAGAQTNINTLYKDNEHVRLSIVIEKQTDYRLILIYINGIMSRAIQYASGERFSQLTPVNITVGSDDCGIDIYAIRVYDNNLTRKQILTNWIADTQIGSLLLDRFEHNNVYDANDRIPPANLPKNLPYMILEAAELSQFKGDKKKIVVHYTDPMYAANSFDSVEVQINVQGTSSAPYYRKNYDLQFTQGFVMNYGTISNYQLRQNSIGFNRFVIKADVASSESANNTGLTMFYHDTCPYRTPEMLEDPRVRWGIEGIPIVVYWYDTETQTTQFLGKYNFNLPKRAPTPLGYSGNMESWEFQRNNSDNVKFIDDDFTSTYFDNDEQTYLPSWYQDFEARMPSDSWRDYSQLKELVSWVKSTNTLAATNNLLDEPVTYILDSNVTLTPYSSDNSFTDTEEIVDGSKTGRHIVEFTKDTAAYRLSKFKAEFDSYFERESALFYYLFTEFFLMIDSRAKNMFIGFRGSSISIPGRAMTRKAVMEPYDMDTAIGTNNSGVLMFSYYYEDIDTVSAVISGQGGSEAPVYNAQDSVVFVNIRKAFMPELIVMYRNLRSSKAWSYDAIVTLFQNHQAKWPEAVYNEDAYEKYLIPLINPVTVDEETGQLIRTDRYLTMLQGSKEEQRKWWIYNRIKYLDSKYTAGDANINIISARLFADGAITITPNIKCYATVQFGGGNALNIQRVNANESVTFNYSAPSGVTEMETYIYSADTIADIGDLSGFYPNEVDLSKATKIRSLKLGDKASNYSNANLRTFDVRNSTLLETIDVRNCPNLAITPNLENSPRLKEAYFEGTAITGVDLADGGALQKLHLPATITTLGLFNLDQLTDLQVASYANVSRLMLANISNSIINPITVLQAMPANSQVYIQGLYLEATTASQIESWLDLFDTMRGVTRERNTATGEWLYYDYDTAQISGEIHIESLTGAEIASFNSRYPYIKVIAAHTTSYRYFRAADNTTNYATVQCIDGVPQSAQPSGPSKSSTQQYTYSFNGWNDSPNQTSGNYDHNAVTKADVIYYPTYIATVRTYTVTWVNNGSTIETDTNVPYGTIPHYDGATPTKDGQTSTGWLPDPTQPITENTTFTAQYLPVYTVTFKNDTGTTTLDTQRVVQGQNATYGGTTPTSSEDASLAWLGWATSANSHTANAVLTNIQSSMIVYAAFESAVEVAEISDSWDTIIANIDNDTYKTKYKIGNYKPLDLGTEGTINMQIVAIDGDVDANNNAIPLTFLGMELLNTMKHWDGASTYISPWSSNLLRSYLQDDIFSLLPANIKERICKAKKYTCDNRSSNNSMFISYDKLWIPSCNEVAVNNYETLGVRYQKIFTTAESRIKKRNASVSEWWLRSTLSNNNKARMYVTLNGNISQSTSPYSADKGVCLGFCLGKEQETITDDWSTILSNANYATDYSIGDTKELDLGAEGKHLMEIVAFDTDDRADGNGKAGITWISKTLLNTLKPMNATSKTSGSDSGYTAGGWENSDMRAYLKNTIKPLIPETVRNAIVPVTKVQSNYKGGTKVKNGQTTTDDVWIPGHHEVGFGTSYESTGTVYSGKFTGEISRIKKRTDTANKWWLRSADTANYFRDVNTDGSNSNDKADNGRGITLGFCTN